MINLAGLVAYNNPPKINMVSKSLREDELQWFVLRDLKRPNAKLPAYKELGGMSVDVFTPMRWVMRKRGERNERRQIPVLQDLLFVHSSLKVMEPIVSNIKTLQFRYSRGGYCKPLTIPEEEMERFIRAVNSTDTPQYFLPGELTPDMCGRKVRIIGGPLNGYEGNLLKIRGSHIRRLIVELPNFLTAGVEVAPEYIQFVDEDQANQSAGDKNVKAGKPSANAPAK